MDVRDMYKFLESKLGKLGFLWIWFENMLWF